MGRALPGRCAASVGRVLPILLIGEAEPALMLLGLSRFYLELFSVKIKVRGKGSTSLVL